jgi:hypothetical protein
MNDTSLETNPTLGDGDDPPDIEITLDDEAEDEAKDYPWAGDNRAVMLRSFIFQTLADSNPDILPVIEHMEACFNWIWDGELPKAKGGGKLKGNHLKPVPAEPA